MNDQRGREELDLTSVTHGVATSLLNQSRRLSPEQKINNHKDQAFFIMKLPIVLYGRLSLPFGEGAYVWVD